MPAPLPLTACEPPQLDWSRPGIPAATGFDDIYFSVDGGLEETEEVYLAGCGLPDAWLGLPKYTVGELGFGSGLNFLATWRMWEKHKPRGAHLHFVSVEKYPFSRTDLARALTAWPELTHFSARLLEVWPGPVKGVHRLHVSEDVTLTLLHDDVIPALQSLQGGVNAWFLDGFSPAKNPEMWSMRGMGELARLSVVGAKIGTFTVAGSVRQALTDVGFHVEKKAGFGRKRHRLEAVFWGGKDAGVDPIVPIVIGAGIAGASLACSFLRRGIVPVVIDPSDGTAASANPAAIVKPRLDLQDRPESRFFLESYLYAIQVYRDMGNVLEEGVFHAAQNESEEKRFEKLVEYAALPPEHMHLATGAFGHQGMLFPKALTINPAAMRDTFLGQSIRVNARAKNIAGTSGALQVSDDSGKVLATGSHIYVTAGPGIKGFVQTEALDVRFSRGQVTMVDRPIVHSETFGGYAVPLGTNTLIGATHARLSEDDPYLPTAKDDDENLTKFHDYAGPGGTIIDGASRASIRVTRANTLPLIAELGDGITAITGLGSRGFVFAPWLAENLVAKHCGEIHKNMISLGKCHSNVT